MAHIDHMMETAAEHKARILSYQAGADPLELLEAAPAALEALVADLEVDDLVRRPAPGLWSIREIVAHLADDELVAAYRIRLILSAPGAVIQSFDQDVWARTGRYYACDVAESVDLFRVLRGGNLRLLRGLRAEQWDAHGIHEERGIETLREIAAYRAGHDINHFRQIEALRRRPRRDCAETDKLQLAGTIL